MYTTAGRCTYNANFESIHFSEVFIVHFHKSLALVCLFIYYLLNDAVSSFHLQG
jgi:hypothetical protein